MTEWSVKTAVEIAKEVFSGGNSSGPADAGRGDNFGKAMGEYIKALAQSLTELQNMIDE